MIASVLHGKSQSCLAVSALAGSVGAGIQEEREAPDSSECGRVSLCVLKTDVFFSWVVIVPQPLSHTPFPRA